MTLPFHAFLGVTIMGQTTLIGGDWYPALHEGPMGAWLPDRCSTTSTWPAGSCGPPATWSALVFFGVLFAQWVRSSMKEAAREDRRLDLLERRTRPPGAVTQPRHAAPVTTVTMPRVTDAAADRRR